MLLELSSINQFQICSLHFTCAGSCEFFQLYCVVRYVTIIYVFTHRTSLIKMSTIHVIDLSNLQDCTRRLPYTELVSEVGCCGDPKLIYNVNYAAQNIDLGQFSGVFEVNNYDETNDKPEKKYLDAVRFIVGPCNHKIS